MTATTSTTRRLLAASALLLAACADSPMAPEVQPEPEAPRVTYRVDVETRYIKIRGSCDTDVFGDEVAGEFQYRIVVSGPDGARPAQASSGYNEWNGTMYQRNATTNINFSNRTYRWSNLPSTSGIRVHLSMAEWDGVKKDDRMANRGGSVAVPYAAGTNTRKITIGATGACQVSMYYDVTWTRTEG
jgi:hypothetical protein